MTGHIRAALKVLFGTAAYVVLVYLVAPLPVAAGTMLTFPALNGLALLYECRAQARAVAGTMLFMPVVNGLLCALFIYAYWWWAPSSRTDEFAVALLIVVAAMWTAFLYWLRRDAGVPERRHFWYVVGCTILFGIAAVLAVSVLSPRGLWALQQRPRTSIDLSAQMLRRVWAANELRIALFVVALAFFVLLTEYFGLPANLKGFFGGFPIVPFGGLLTIALDRPAGLDVQLATFGALAAGVWFSPIVPVWFIYGYSRYLSRTAARAPARFGVLALAWAVCFLAIVSLSQAFSTTFAPR